MTWIMKYKKTKRRLILTMNHCRWLNLTHRCTSYLCTLFYLLQSNNVCLKIHQKIRAWLSWPQTWPKRLSQFPISNMLLTVVGLKSARLTHAVKYSRMIYHGSAKLVLLNVLVALETLAKAGASSSRRPHRRKERIPPGQAARDAANTLRHNTTNTDDTGPQASIIDMSVYERAAQNRTHLP